MMRTTLSNSRLCRHSLNWHSVGSMTSLRTLPSRSRQCSVAFDAAVR